MEKENKKKVIKERRILGMQRVRGAKGEERRERGERERRLRRERKKRNKIYYFWLTSDEQ